VLAALIRWPWEWRILDLGFIFQAFNYHVKDTYVWSAAVAQIKKRMKLFCHLLYPRASIGGNQTLDFGGLWGE
jgi:hypothetical protein